MVTLPIPYHHSNGCVSHWLNGMTTLLAMHVQLLVPTGRDVIPRSLDDVDVQKGSQMRIAFVH